MAEEAHRWARVATVVAGIFLTVCGAAAAQPLPPDPPPLELIDPDASAALAWSVPSRYDASWEAWRTGSATYDGDAVTPRRWSINLNACDSRAVRRIERFTFVVTGITDPSFRRTFDGVQCRRALRRVLPGLGRYRVEVTVHTALGASVVLPRIVEVRDYLIVTVGDSLQSGEGVPDVAGVAPAGAGVRWKDRRCHRSARSGPALAAKAIEDASPHTSVTFLSFACSGAELKHVYTRALGGARYEGADPRGATGTLPPQLDAVGGAVGPGATNGRPREIDALLVDGGINDLHFSTVIRACATNRNSRPGHTDCVTGFAASKLVGKPEFAARYDRLAEAIRGLQVRETYLNGYPSQVFRGGGCGLLGVGFIGIDAAEGEAMNTLGIALNGQVDRAVRRHLAEGWNLVEDLTEPFRTHAYCDDVPWFNTLANSLDHQGDERGTAHPNRAGHRAFGRILGRAIVPNQPQTPFRETTLTVDALKLSAVGTGKSQTLDLRLVQYPRDFVGITRTVSVPRNGQWTTIPAAIGTFPVSVFREPASPRHATEVRLVIERILPIHHGFADGYGSGAHEITHPTGSLAARYHIDVRGPSGSNPPVRPTAGG